MVETQISEKWDKRLLGLAEHVSQWSKDPSTRVGCVLALGKSVVSIGYNGFPPGMVDDDRLFRREVKYDYVLHAEENALLNMRAKVPGLTAYVWPLHPCTRCASKLIAYGVQRIVAKRPSADHSERYNLQQVVDLCTECGVKLHLIGE